jgi:hypothetical protein
MSFIEKRKVSQVDLLEAESRLALVNERLRAVSHVDLGRLIETDPEMAADILLLQVQQRWGLFYLSVLRNH